MFEEFLSNHHAWRDWAQTHAAAAAAVSGASSAEYRLMALAEAASWLVNMLQHSEPASYPPNVESFEVWCARLVREMHEIVDGLLTLRANPNLKQPQSPPAKLVKTTDAHWFFAWRNLFGRYAAISEQAGWRVIDAKNQSLVAKYLSLRWGKGLCVTIRREIVATTGLLKPKYLAELRAALDAASKVSPDLFPAAWCADGEAFLVELTAATARIAAGETDVRVGLFPLRAE